MLIIGNYMEGRGWTWEFAALFDQFFCKPKLALKK